MTVHVPDRLKAANAFWIELRKVGLTPAAVLSQARLPLTVYDGKKNLVTTAQFCALWRAVGELSADPAAGLKIATQIDVGNRRPSVNNVKTSAIVMTSRRRNWNCSVCSGNCDIVQITVFESVSYLTFAICGFGTACHRM
jgi:hypothetical protein